jgi:hypothetical protein
LHHEPAEFGLLRFSRWLPANMHWSWPRVRRTGSLRTLLADVGLRETRV